MHEKYSTIRKNINLGAVIRVFFLRLRVGILQSGHSVNLKG